MENLPEDKTGGGGGPLQLNRPVRINLLQSGPLPKSWKPLPVNLGKIRNRQKSRTIVPHKGTENRL